VRIGDLVRYCSDSNDGRLGLVVSEIFDTRPDWHDFYPAVDVLTRHQHTGEEGRYVWMLEDIEVLSENR
jgi:hypothetical protein